jgi:RimJ/RimL family protein N-acetyltransferase
LSEEVSFKLVNSLRDALIVRKMRNSCRDYLTNFRGHLGHWQQIRWYLKDYRRAVRSSSYRIFLFSANDEPVGYGALQLVDDSLYVTECVETQYRGKGFGKAILARMIEIAREEKRRLVAEIWASNQQSIALHLKAGFVFQSSRAKAGQELHLYYLVS